MIALFPMLVSNTVSKNIIPGISKVLENYLMVYGITDIMRKARSGVKGSPDYSFKNKKLIQRESEDPLADYMFREIMFEAGMDDKYPGTATKPFGPSSGDSEKMNTQTTPADEYDKSYEKEKGKQAAQAKDASVAIGAFEMKSISLEPTWMKTDIVSKDGSKTSGIIGVKVVPYPVKSDAKLAHLLMYDRHVSKLQGLVIRKGRAVENFFYRAWKMLWKIPSAILGDSGEKGLSGNPKQDILARRTILKAKDASDIFVCVNQADLSEDFYTSANGILNLFRMGWSSIIIVDDVNRRVSFCMRELKGLCSMMPFTMLYQTYQQAKVYEDLEDAKRSASSIFKVQRKKFSKIVGEGYAQSKIEEFGMQNMPLLESDTITEMNYIDENMASFMKTLSPAKLKTTFINLLRGNTKGMPDVPPGKLIQAGTKASPNFKKSYMLAKKVLDNTAPEIKNKKVVELAAITIAAKSTIEVAKDIKKDITTSTKEKLKQFVKNYRKNRDGVKPKSGMPVEHYAEATFGWIAIIAGLTAASVISVKLVQLAGKIPNALANLTDYIPKAGEAVRDFTSGAADKAAEVSNFDFDISSAPVEQIGILAVIAMIAGGILMRIIIPKR